MTALLEINGLSVVLGGRRVTDGVALSVPQEGTVGLVGESGSGKSVTLLSVMRLLDEPPACGRISFEGRELTGLPEEGMRKLRGNRLAMIFQDPTASLNPVMRAGDQIAEPLVLHRGMSRKEARRRAAGLLAEVGVPDPELRASSYPHELSGGLRQRVMIAMAIACEPALLMADEPTTALDVTVQAQVLDVLEKLQKERRMGLLLVSHDLGLVGAVCDNLAVMYAGQVVERGLTREVLKSPGHPYTAGLIACTPGFAGGRVSPKPIPGAVPEPGSVLSGCRFAPRCAMAADRCCAEAPAWSGAEGGAGCLCHFPIGGGL